MSFFDRHLHMNMFLMILTMMRMRITSVLLTYISHIVDVFKRHLQSYNVIPSSDIHKMLLLQMTLLVYLPCSRELREFAGFYRSWRHLPVEVLMSVQQPRTKTAS